MSEITHTQLPWKFTPWHIEEDAASVRAPEGWAICFTSSDGNAEFIVKACNAFYGNQADLAAKDADIARLREALESLISAAEEFHEAATAHLSDTTFDRDGILAAREAELTVAALPDARAALAGGSDGTL